MNPYSATERADLTAASGSALLVGISVSDPPRSDMLRLGISEVHIRHAFIEIVRHILSAGWSVAYGGDFREHGYTNALVDLVRTYERRDAPEPERVLTYLAWPLAEQLTARDRAQLVNVATIRAVAAPLGAPRLLPAMAERSATERLWAARALTAMREQMTGDLDARIVLGGRLAGQQGLLPGIAEEAILAIQHQKPLFVLGGFGGCAGALVRGLRGEVADELTSDYQIRHTSGYQELVHLAMHDATHTPLEAVVNKLASVSAADLRNGLSDQENDRLFVSDELDETISLVLRGLRRLAGDQLT